MSYTCVSYECESVHCESCECVCVCYECECSLTVSVFPMSVSESVCPRSATYMSPRSPILYTVSECHRIALGVIGFHCDSMVISL